MISTKRLILRRAETGDLSDLHEVLSNPDAMRYWDCLPHSTLNQTERFLNGMIRSSPPASDDFVLEFEGKVIGKAGCWRRAEVGFILHPDAWGRGLAQEALCAVLPHGFTSLSVDTIEAEVDPRNGRSLKLLQKLGFKETHRATQTLKVGDEWCDSVYLKVTRTSFVTTDKPEL